MICIKRRLEDGGRVGESRERHCFNLGLALLCEINTGIEREGSKENGGLRCVWSIDLPIESNIYIESNWICIFIISRNRNMITVFKWTSKFTSPQRLLLIFIFYAKMISRFDKYNHLFYFLFSSPSLTHSPVVAPAKYMLLSWWCLCNIYISIFVFGERSNRFVFGWIGWNLFFLLLFSSHEYFGVRIAAKQNQRGKRRGEREKILTYRNQC